MRFRHFVQIAFFSAAFALLHANAQGIPAQGDQVTAKIARDYDVSACNTSPYEVVYFGFAEKFETPENYPDTFSQSLMPGECDTIFEHSSTLIPAVYLAAFVKPGDAVFEYASDYDWHEEYWSNITQHGWFNRNHTGRFEKTFCLRRAQQYERSALTTSCAKEQTFTLDVIGFQQDGSYTFETWDEAFLKQNHESWWDTVAKRRRLAHDLYKAVSDRIQRTGSLELYFTSGAHTCDPTTKREGRFTVGVRVCETDPEPPHRARLPFGRGDVVYSFDGELIFSEADFYLKEQTFGRNNWMLTPFDINVNGTAKSGLLYFYPEWLDSQGHGCYYHRTEAMLDGAIQSFTLGAFEKHDHEQYERSLFLKQACPGARTVGEVIGSIASVTGIVMAAADAGNKPDPNETWADNFSRRLTAGARQASEGALYSYNTAPSIEANYSVEREIAISAGIGFVGGFLFPDF